MLTDQSQSDEASPVLTHQRDVDKTQTVEEELSHPLHVPGIGVVDPFGRLVRSPEPDEVGRHDL
jgi:hypothetical protein